MLPPGLTLDSSTGVISGTPTVPGVFNYIVQVTDSLGNSVETDGCSIQINSESPDGIWVDS